MKNRLEYRACLGGLVFSAAGLAVLLAEPLGKGLLHGYARIQGGLAERAFRRKHGAHIIGGAHSTTTILLRENLWHEQARLAASICALLSSACLLAARLAERGER